MPIESAGRRIASADLSLAAEASAGYPYLTQVIGDQVWRQDPDSDAITHPHVLAGIDAAIREFGSAVHEPALMDLSDVDRHFVIAMSADEHESRTADIASRMGRDQSYISRYRSRLLVAGIIEPGRYGHVRFTIPYLREFILANQDRL